MEGFDEWLKRKAFLVQSSELYGGLAGFYDYGHSGARVKRKFENLWLRYFLNLGDNFHEISGAEIMPEEVFRASGHLEHFDDPLVACSKCNFVERADKLLEKMLKERFDAASSAEIDAHIKKHNLKCPECKSYFKPSSRMNLMFPVAIGRESKRAFLRPETAQLAYVNFAREFEATRKRLPLGLAVVGRAFRNEISPRQGVIRAREFTQAELQIFFDPEKINEHEKWDEVRDYELQLLWTKDRKGITTTTCEEANKKGIPKFYLYHMAKYQQFLVDVLGIPAERIRFYEMSEDERAFYNKIHWDLEVELPTLGGFTEVGAVHYRTDHDLSGHARVSKKSQEIFYDGRRFVPHVLEVTSGVDRMLYAVLEVSFRKTKDRIVASLPARIAPYDAAVFPLVNRDGMDAEASKIFETLRQALDIFYDDSGSIGRRYARADEVGIPYCITVDGDTLKDGTVTVRDRDTGEQKRFDVKNLEKLLVDLLAGKKKLVGISRE